MDNIIFRYTLSDAWYKKITSLEILDKKDNNVVCSEGGQLQTYSIEEESLDNIIEILRKFEVNNKSMLEEFPPILDGVSNIYEINIDDKNIEFESSNLWWFSNSENIDRYYKNKGINPIKSLKAIELHDEIRKILVTFGIDNKFFRLK